MNVLAVALVRPTPEGAPITLNDLRSHLAGLLDRLAFLRWRVCAVPGRLHHPVYVEDPAFELDRHVIGVTLPSPGDDLQLDRYLATLSERSFDRERPLWQMVLVDGLADGRQAVVTRLHHCYVDGTAALTAFAAIFHGPDRPPAAGDRDPHGSGYVVGPEPSPARLVTDALVDQACSLRRLPRLVRASAKALRTLRRTEEEMERAGTPPLRTPADTPRTVFAEAFEPGLVTARVSFSREDLAEVRTRIGVSPNDVILAVVAGALRAYLEERGGLPPRPLVSAVPVALTWPDDGRRVHGNHILGLSVRLATHIADPIERLRAISIASSQAKSLLAAADPELWWTWLDVIPPVIAEWATRRLYERMRADRDRVPQNLLVSHFAGPARPWGLLGTRCEEWYWYGPPNQGVGLNLSIWTYAGRACMGIEAFASALTDPAALVGWLGRSLDELVAAARAYGPAGVAGGPGRPDGVALA